MTWMQWREGIGCLTVTTAIACGGTAADGSTIGHGSETSEQTGPSSGATEGGSDASSGGSGSADTSGSIDDSGASTGGDTLEPASWQAVLQLSSFAVLEADDGGALTASCTVLHDGLPYDGDFTAELTVTPMRGVTIGEQITFAEFGTHELACAIEVEGEMLGASAEIAVLDEAIDPVLAQLGEGIAGVEAGIFAVLDADMEDDAVLVAAHERLLAAAPQLEADAYAELDDVVRRIPGDWPSDAVLDAVGVATNPDDAALPAALTNFIVALGMLDTTMAGIDPAALTDADLAAMTERTAALQATVDELEALQPTAHGLLATRAQATALMKDHVRSTAAATLAFDSALVQAQADRIFAYAPVDDLAAGRDPLRFGFLSLAIGSFGQSYTQIQLINKWYGKYIKELDKSINNLILIGAIDYYLPVDPNGPVIDYLVASASLGFATPGYPSWVDGYNFHEDADTNLFLVIGDQWQGVLEQIFSACGVEEAKTVPAKIEKVLKCIDEIEEAVDSLFLYPVSVGPGIYGSAQGLDLGAFPQACSGPLPIAIGLIPINMAVGRGPSYTINCVSGGG
jgi:hypothetical protein